MFATITAGRSVPIFLCLVCFVSAAAMPLSAQDGQATQPGGFSPQTGQTSAAPASAKRVWTNDDLSGLHKEASISSFGSSPAPLKPAKTASPTPKRSAAWYREQIAKFQAKIPPIDAQMADLQAAIDGKPTGDAKKSERPYNVRADDWRAQLNQLGKQRGDISEKISELRDEARHDGIPVSALP
jgi:hypothetical protein